MFLPQSPQQLGLQACTTHLQPNLVSTFPEAQSRWGIKGDLKNVMSPTMQSSGYCKVVTACWSQQQVFLFINLSGTKSGNYHCNTAAWAGAQRLHCNFCLEYLVSCSFPEIHAFHKEAAINHWDSFGKNQSLCEEMNLPVVDEAFFTPFLEDN